MSDYPMPDVTMLNNSVVRAGPGEPTAVDDADVQTFVLPPYDQGTQPMSPEGASENAFYAAATSSENPRDDFLNAEADLVTKGQSPFVDAAKERWKTEQDETNKKVISELIQDDSIPVDQKRAMLNTYAAGGYVSPSLRDKYIQKQVSLDNATTNDDRVAQENTASHILTNVKTMKEKEKAHQTNEMIDDVMDYGKAGLGMLSNIAKSAFTGWAGIYSLLKERDNAKANYAIQQVDKVLSEYSYSPTGKGVQEAQEKIGKVFDTLEIPAEWIADKTLDVTGSAGAATGARIFLDPLNYIPLGVLNKVKGVPKFKPASVADVTRTANMMSAKELFQAGLMEETGSVARAMGTDKGTIIQESVLPKLFDEDTAIQNPDLVDTIKRMDSSADYSFNLFKYDPNILDVAKREEDLNAILAVTKETGSPYYQQANSTLTSPGVGVFEGKAVYGRSDVGNFVTKEGAEYALAKMQESVNNLPEDLRGELSIQEVNKGTITKQVPTGELSKSGKLVYTNVTTPTSEYVIEHKWRKEYDELDSLVFGPDAVQSTVLGGISINGLKHTPLGKWLFTTDVFDKKYESGAAGSVQRGAKQANDTLKFFRESISNVKAKRELAHLVNEAERTGQEYFPKSELHSMFPHLSTGSINELFDASVVWRRIAHYEHRILNNMKRNEMLIKDFKSVYDKDGTHLTDVSIKVDPAEATTIKEVYDMHLDAPTPSTKYTKDSLGITRDEQGRQLVRLHDPVMSDGKKYNYGLLAPDHKVDVLRANVLPRISGWSPRRHSNHFYIDAIPREMTIDGIKVTNSDVLRGHRKTLSGASTQYQATKLAKEMAVRNPESDVVVRPDRLESYGKILEDYETSTDLYAHARKRGEGLANSNLEDRLTSFVKSVRALAHNNTASTWELATQKSFVKSYKEFLPEGRFPDRRSDIVPKNNMTIAEKNKFQSAVALYENYARFKSYEYPADAAWKGLLHKAADIFEKIHIPAGILRDVAKRENPFVALPKKAGSIMFINMNPVRQWLVQPQQAFEIYSLNPTHWAKNISDIARIGLYFTGDSPFMGVTGKALKLFAEKVPNFTGEAEFKDMIQAIKDSGIIESVDTNVLVHGVLSDLEAPLVPTGTQTAGKYLKAPVTIPSHVGRAVGYDKAELTNKIGIWLAMRNRWIAKHPNEDWRTAKVQAELAHDVRNYSGNMDKAGNLPYQSGMLSPIFQFTAIGQKVFMNMIQDNATSLSKLDRVKLSAIRATMLGVKYGLPGGGLLYAYIENYGSDETKANMAPLKDGLANMLVNQWMDSLYPPEDGQHSDIAVGKGLSPFGESGVPYADFAIEMMKLYDGKEATNPRFPMVSVATTLGTTIDRWGAVWDNEDYSDSKKLEIAFREGASMTSGFNNWFKYKYMLGMESKLTKYGNTNGLEYTAGEATAQLFGFGSNKDEILYKALSSFQDHDQGIKDTAKDIYTNINYLESMYDADGKPVDKLRMMAHALNVAVDDAHLTPQDKQDIMEQVLQLASQNKSAKDNLILKTIEQMHNQGNDSVRKAFDIMEQDNSPQIKGVLEQLKKGNP